MEKPKPISVKNLEEMRELLDFSKAVYRENLTGDGLFRLDVVTNNCLKVDWRNVKVTNILVEELKKFGLIDLRASGIAGSVFLYKPVNGVMKAFPDNPQTKIMFKVRLDTPLYEHLIKIKVTKS